MAKLKDIRIALFEGVHHVAEADKATQTHIKDLPSAVNKWLAEQPEDAELVDMQMSSRGRGSSHDNSVYVMVTYKTN
jgi:hypothetical protein